MSLLNQLRDLWHGPDETHLQRIENEELTLVRAKSQELQMSKKVSSELSGDYASAFLGQGLSFAELRDYQPGDDPRNIQWNVTARFGKPFVKVFREERQLRMVLLLDTSASVALTSCRKRALEFASLLFSVSKKNRDQIGLGTFSETLQTFIPPKSSRSHYRQLLFELNKPHTAGKKTDLNAAFRDLNEKLPKHTNLFLLSDFDCELQSQELSAAARAHDITAVYLPSDDFPRDLNGFVRVRAAEGKGYATRDTSSLEQRQAFEETEEKRYREAERSLRIQGLDVVRFERDAFSTMDQLTRRRRKKRR